MLVYIYRLKTTMVVENNGRQFTCDSLVLVTDADPATRLNAKLPKPGAGVFQQCNVSLAPLTLNVLYVYHTSPHRPVDHATQTARQQLARAY